MVPSTVRVRFVGATIGLGKADGTQWDGLPGTRVPPQAAGLLGTALKAANPVAAIGALFALESAPAALQALEKPDPGGTATLRVDGSTVGLAQLAKLQDTFTPQWSNASWSDVSLASRVRLEVTLWDRDVANDDPMGTVQLNEDHLKAALDARTVHHVQVHEQSNQQILLLAIAVD